jgi:predicted ATPase
MFALMRNDLTRVALNVAELARLTREHDLPMWRACRVFLNGLIIAQNGPPGGGLEDMRHGVELLREQNAVSFDGLIKIPLAEAEAHAGDIDRAVAILDEGLATSERIGHRTFDAELHRVRGEMLLKRDPTAPDPAEAALKTAIAVAKRQGTRSFGLRAALSGHTLPIGWSPGRRRSRPCAGVGGLFADAGDAGDRGGASASTTTGVGRFGSEVYFTHAIEWQLSHALRSFPWQPL